MGHKYSTIYTHNTDANLESNQLINSIVSKIGKENCMLFKKYPGHNKCRLCFNSTSDTQVLVLKCHPLRHRYHTKCIAKYSHHFNSKHFFTCAGCRNILKIG